MHKTADNKYKFLDNEALINVTLAKKKSRLFERGINASEKLLMYYRDFNSR